jgi:hypothetical protein
MSLATGTSGAMTFSEHLVLWLHVAFVIFTVGPLTVAIMSTPRYIRKHNVAIVRYLSRITFVFTVGSLGVLIAGVVLGQMLKVASKPWLIVSATLFLVAIVLLGLIVRDQRRAIRAMDEATEHAGGQAVAVVDPTVADQSEHLPEHDTDDAPQGGPAASPASPPHHLATVERGRIAMLGGVVGLIYLVILVLMVWNS